MTKELRICEQGHRYYKSSDCPVCPQCEAEKKPADGFLQYLAAPGRRALLQQGIRTPEQLAKFTEHEIASLHGMGPGSLKRLKILLQEKGLQFK